MRNFLTSNQHQQKSSNHDQILKVTALLYLKEALIKEEYEDCSNLIQNAKDFGAEDKEISELILQHIRGIKGKQKKMNVTRRF